MRNSRGLGNLSKSLVWESNLSKGGGDPSIRSEGRRLVFMCSRPLQKDLSSAAVTNWKWGTAGASNPGIEGNRWQRNRVAKETINKGRGPRILAGGSLKPLDGSNLLSFCRAFVPAVVYPLIEEML
jgi:hypothetical protein